MDTSETYIKMCDCLEIQSAKPSKYDWLCSVYYGWHIVELAGSKQHLFAISHPSDVANGSIWLPRQEQLQEMVSFERGYMFTYLSLIRSFCSAYGQVKWSMEQLWLAFVMKKNHGKVWENETWRLTKR